MPKQLWFLLVPWLRAVPHAANILVHQSTHSSKLVRKVRLTAKRFVSAFYVLNWKKCGHFDCRTVSLQQLNFEVANEIIFSLISHIAFSLEEFHSKNINFHRIQIIAFFYESQYFIRVTKMLFVAAFFSDWTSSLDSALFLAQKHSFVVGNFRRGQVVGHALGLT